MQSMHGVEAGILAAPAFFRVTSARAEQVSNT